MEQNVLVQGPSLVSNIDLFSCIRRIRTHFDSLPRAVQHTLKKHAIDMELHKESRTRLVAKLKKDGAKAGSVVLLQGGETDYRHETDHEKVFRQESFFAWAFGVKEPDCYGSIDVDTGKSTLFIPRLPDAYAVWMGPILTPAQWKEMYQVDEVQYTDELVTALAACPCILLLSGFNTDGKRHARPASFPGLEKLGTDSTLLWPAITECRVFKTEREISLLKYSAAITSEAHIAVMQHTVAMVKAGKAISEYQLESLFYHWCYYHGGCRHMSYTCICATGGNGAVLHYGHAGQPNSKPIKNGDMCLFDMGSEYHYYGSDITTTFPANGVFTADQRIVYNAVWDAVKAVEDSMKPGVAWTDMHALAYRTVLTHLRDGGLLKWVLTAPYPTVSLATLMLTPLTLSSITHPLSVQGRC